MKCIAQSLENAAALVRANRVEPSEIVSVAAYPDGLIILHLTPTGFARVYQAHLPRSVMRLHRTTGGDLHARFGECGFTWWTMCNSDSSDAAMIESIADSCPPVEKEDLVTSA